MMKVIDFLKYVTPRFLLAGRWIAGSAVAGWVVCGGIAVAREAAPPPPEPAAVIARVGEHAITRADLGVRSRILEKKRRRKLSPREMAPLVERMVEQALFAEEARALGLDRDESLRVLIRDTVDKILANAYYTREVLPRIQVTEDAIKAYYEGHPERFRQPETVRARHILLRVRSDDTAGVITRAETTARELKGRLDKGEDFAELARRYSDDTGTREKGGDLGFFNRRGKTKALSDAAFSLAPGEISDPVRTSVGYHVLKLEERKPAAMKPFARVKAEIRNILRKEKRAAVAREDKARLEKKYKVYIAPEYTQLPAGDQRVARERD